MGQCTKGFKCKFSHDLNVQRKGEKLTFIVISVTRVLNYSSRGTFICLLLVLAFMAFCCSNFWLALFLSETMEDWDQDTLEKVVESKKTEYNQNKPTDIVSCFI